MIFTEADTHEAEATLVGVVAYEALTALLDHDDVPNNEAVIPVMVYCPTLRYEAETELEAQEALTAENDDEA